MKCVICFVVLHTCSGKAIFSSKFKKLSFFMFLSPENTKYLSTERINSMAKSIHCSLKKMDTIAVGIYLFHQDHITHEHSQGRYLHYISFQKSGKDSELYCRVSFETYRHKRTFLKTPHPIFRYMSILSKRNSHNLICD